MHYLTGLIRPQLSASTRISTLISIVGASRAISRAHIFGMTSPPSTGITQTIKGPTQTSSMSTKSVPVIRDVPSLRALRKEQQSAGHSLGFVPTMGALHQGHMSLVKQAAAENDRVIVSIYVNPTQFGVNEDLDSYPKTWEADMARLGALNEELRSLSRENQEQGPIAAVFAPTTKTMYPTLPPTSEIDGPGSFVTLTPIGQILEGASRPVFFRGVATVCMKLFNVVVPDNVYFGQKDVQQTVVIRQMVRDFHLDVNVRIGPTLREPNGLAMSSRNLYLGQRRYAVGAVLYRALLAAEAQVKSAGKRTRGDVLWAANDVVLTEKLRQEALPQNQRALFDIDYLSLADPDSMAELDEIDESRGAIISGAIKMMPVEAPSAEEDCGLGDGAVSVRLIDNIIIAPKTP